MCGIAGFLDLSRQSNDQSLNGQVTAMMDAIKHRGPDDSGTWTSAEQGVALGFRRLSILDLSPSGHQPMISSDGRYVIIFNGEIYNFAVLRAELVAAGHSFRGTSDTEVMLAAILHWGLKNAVCRLNGMYAIALWDRQEERLHLIRDRVGVKPLYYGWVGSLFLFGSELKALRVHPAFNFPIDRDSLTLYFRYSYIPAPFSIYKGIKKLLPGSILSLNTRSQRSIPDAVPYWSMKDVVQQDRTSHYSDGDEHAIQSLEELLRASVKDRMIADVPLGAFLSGGIDSSTIVALMQAQSRERVKTFTIGFQEAAYDESQYAEVVARHLGTDHTRLYVTSQDAMDVIPQLPALYDEPFADPSQIPTFLVSKLARQHVTVSLSGDGGDELFGGYPRYFRSQKVWEFLRWFSSHLRSQAGSFLSNLSAQGMGDRLSTRLYYISETLKARTAYDLYHRLVSHWEQPVELVVNGTQPVSVFDEVQDWQGPLNFSEQMMLLDFLTYLPDDILVKLDRASMAASLEGRVPFLDDHRVVEFAWRLPHEMKMRNGQGKWILRQVLYRYLPKDLVERPKMGFALPVDIWLKGPLREWAEALLDEGRISAEGFLNPKLVREKWLEHLHGQRNWQYHLWSVLMFQSWLFSVQEN